MLSKQPSVKAAPAGRPVAAERRSESRRPASGMVRMRQAGVPVVVFGGELLDTAPMGFRARHGRLSLVSGQIVDFEFGERKGVARAVWTRIVDGQAETGFRILPAEPD